MDAALFIRVSTKDQDAANQIPALEKIAAARGFTIVERFTETMSGAKKARPQLNALIKGAQQGRYRVILVWAIDRLGRNMMTVMNTVVGLDAIGVSVVSHQEPWLDTQGPVRPLLLSIFSWVAQQERERLIERTNAGLDKAREEGKTLGRPKRAVDLDEALRLRKDGLTIAQVAKKLKVGTGTLHRALCSDDVPASARARMVSNG